MDGVWYLVGGRLSGKEAGKHMCVCSFECVLQGEESLSSSAFLGWDVANFPVCMPRLQVPSPQPPIKQKTKFPDYPLGVMRNDGSDGQGSGEGREGT